MAMEGAILSFAGVDGYDVYNTSVPFAFEGETYLFGRVERRDEWAASHVRLFKQTGQDNYTLVEDGMIYPLEDPCITKIGDEYVLCGTHVQKSKGKVETYYAYFYRGRDIFNLRYFTTGPQRMKDIRLVQLADGRIGVFSRPRGPEIEAKYGSGSIVGFTVIDNLNELDAKVVQAAPKVEGLFEKGEWGGCNQAYLLKDGTIGVIGHRSRAEIDSKGIKQKIYDNVAFHFDPVEHALMEYKTIAERRDFPAYDAKMPDLAQCAFASGVVPHSDGWVELYSGLGDACEGRLRIQAPFGIEWPTI